jgi:pimeloyl-ACP methyl ester carboxylesterase
MRTQISAAPGQTWVWQDEVIYYVRAGEPRADRPPLLLVHGFGASTDHWKKNIAGLQADFDVWAIDLLGFGRSAKPPITYGSELWRDQLHDFIQQVIQRPVVLAGNSLGGYAALCLAAQRPESASGLVLLNSAGPFSDSLPSSEPSPLQRTVRWIIRQPWVSWMIFQNLRRKATIRKTLSRIYLDQSAITDELIDDIYRPSCDAGACEVFSSVFKTPQGAKVDELLCELRHPLLLLWGEADPWMRVQERSPRFRQYYPALTEHFLHAGHCPHDEVPDEVNRLLSEWVLEVC